MLRSFRVANHRSIREAQELVLPAYDKSRPVTPVAALYGANASGKSNVLDALRWMRTAVLDSFASWTPGGGVPRVPFKLDPAAATEPSEYAVDLTLDGVRHHYGFVVDDEGVREEWLHTYPKNRRRIIFERDGDRWTFGTTVRGPMESTRERTRLNALFLSVAARSEVPDAVPTFAWFQSTFFHRRPADLRPSLVRRLREGGASRAELVELIRTADVGEPRFRQGQRGVTLRLDELDLSLRPRLVARLIELFADDRTNPRHAQLVFTTHDAALLGTSLGVPVLERDQVWFVEKAADGATSLFPLTDFRPRKEENTERRYLGGSYGAVPAIYSDSLVERLAAVREGPDPTGREFTHNPSTNVWRLVERIRT